jgi:integrase
VADLEKRHRAGRNGSGGRKLKTRITTLLNECKWKVAYNINADSFVGWRARQDKSARTLNHYLQAMVSFLNWLERMGRIKGNPLKFVGKIDERGQSKRVRRALSDDELRRLVAGSEWRGLVYFVAARTGLRQQELRELIWDDVRLEETVPYVRVRIVCAKNKAEEHVALVPEVCEALRAHRPAKYSPSALVFERGVPRAARLRVDSENNGIAYKDQSGRYADFHALRYTWATFLQRHGIAQRFAMKLLRHSDIKLTSKVYTDESQLPIYDAIKALPRLADHTHIRAQMADSRGCCVTQADAESGGSESGEKVSDEELRRMVTHPVVTGQGLEARGVEPLSSSLSA